MSHSTEWPGMDSTLGKFCKFRPSRRLGIWGWAQPLESFANLDLLNAWGWAQPLESFANLDLLNACILPFRRLKKTVNLKGCYSKSYGDAKLLLFNLIFGEGREGFMFYLRAWSTSLLGLIVGG